ncbi:MAG: oligopeptide transporter, permease component [Rhodospirillales bacterium]|nr:oligopeptide transporter, permease component [Rhodospirillales bacterium]
MIAYILRRLLLIPPTLFGILLLNFTIVQFAPGGPVEQMISRLQADSDGVAAAAPSDGNAGYRGAEGLDPKLVKEIEHQFGFDKPPLERFELMIGNYLRFDLGESYFRGERVASLIWRKLPTSFALAFSATLIAYLVSVPLGIAKAVRDGSRFDLITSLAIVFAYAVPGYLFAVLMIEFLAGGSYFQIFPLRGLMSNDWAMLPWWRKPLDLGWHLVLPVTALVAGSFARPTLLTKNAFIEEIGKQYVMTARAKGLTPNRVLYGHVFRNAILVVVVGFPSAFMRMLFVGALLIEIIFSLDGMGLLGFESVVTRDYPVVFGTLYVFTLLGLLVNILTDIATMAIDPRIDFAGRVA